jgi:Cu/Ag efflux pump CusA
VYGADLDTLDKSAAEIATVLEKVPGAVDVQVQTPPSTPVVRVDLDFQALAHYGVSAAEALTLCSRRSSARQRRRSFRTSAPSTSR